MSTRSLIAKAEGDGFTEGIFIHSSGMPTSRGPVMFALWDAYGPKLYDVIAKGGRWSSLFVEDPLPEWATDYLKMMGGRLTWQPGVGLHFVDEETDYRLSWHGEDFDSDCEWAWVLNGALCSVFTLGSHPRLMDVFSLEGEQPDWGKIECGANFEHCSHMAYFHFPDIDPSCRRLNTAQYLGRQPLDADDAYAVIDASGKEWTLIGGGGRNTTPSGGYGKKWLAGAQCGDEYRTIHLWTASKNGRVPNPKLTLLYPAIREVAA